MRQDAFPHYTRRPYVRRHRRGQITRQLGKQGDTFTLVDHHEKTRSVLNSEHTIIARYNDNIQTLTICIS